MFDPRSHGSGERDHYDRGLGKGDELHPVQAAFIECDGFQCGYCTPGQIMSAVACINEGHTGSDREIREFMSGNLCRCGAYPNIVDAIKIAAAKMKASKLMRPFVYESASSAQQAATRGLDQIQPLSLAGRPSSI